MTVYTAAALSPSAWPLLMETVYQQLPTGGAAPAGARRGDLSVADRLFAAAVVAIPRADRYGAVTWVASALAASRQTIYDIAAATQRHLTPVPPRVEPLKAERVAVPRVSDNDLARAALTLLFPGGVTLRPMAMCLDELLGTSRSPAWLCDFFNATGQRAGLVLDRADWSAVAPFVASRDEKFFDDRAYMLTIHPASLATVSGHVEDGVDAERWAVSLGLDQLKTGGALLGLAEDAATWYPASLAGAASLLGTPWLMPVQKDVFHVLQHATQTLVDVERIALGKLAAAEKKVKPGLTGSGLVLLRDPAGYQAARRAANATIQVAQNTHFWVHCLHDAFELVDPRSGEICDPDTARWYLDEVLAGLDVIDNRRVVKLLTYINGQKSQLFTFLEWLAVALDPWRAQATDHFGDAPLVQLFERAVARAWRLRHAVDTGAPRLRPAAKRAEAEVASLCQHDPRATCLATELAAILEMTVRTSSANECVNSVLELYLAAHKSFQGRVSAQNFLNLFILWFCLHRFERGKRRGHSPFEIAGVRVFDPDGRETDDWLAALGYPKAA